MQPIREAYERWIATRTSEDHFGPFSAGWSDERLHHSDFNRRTYSAMSGAREAYMAGREAARRVKAAA